VSAGNYLRQARFVTWPLADTFIWLDIGLPTPPLRIIARSWRRWRSRELLWGVCRETFWRHLQPWDERRSLIRYIQHRRHIQHRRRSEQREAFRAAFDDAAAAGKTVLRFRSQREGDRFVSTLP
jgi:hypothetical protein